MTSPNVCVIVLEFVFARRKIRIPKIVTIFSQKASNTPNVERSAVFQPSTHAFNCGHCFITMMSVDSVALGNAMLTAHRRVAKKNNEQKGLDT